MVVLSVSMRRSRGGGRYLSRRGGSFGKRRPTSWRLVEEGMRRPVDSWELIALEANN